MTRKKASTQPLCLWCWYATQTRAPACTPGDAVSCSECGRPTRDGLTVEVQWQDRKDVPFPAYIQG